MQAARKGNKGRVSKFGAKFAGRACGLTVGNVHHERVGTESFAAVWWRAKRRRASYWQAMMACGSGRCVVGTVDPEGTALGPQVTGHAESKKTRLMARQVERGADRRPGGKPAPPTFQRNQKSE